MAGMAGHQKPGSELAGSAKFIGGFSGDVVDANDYVFSFIYTAMLGIPAILLILYLMKRKQGEHIY